MNKRHFISIFISLFLVFNFSCIKSKISSSEKLAEPSTARYRLVWNEDPTTTITVAWDQSRGENPVIYYGVKDFNQKWKNYPYSQQPTSTMIGYRGMNTHFAKLTGLKPDQVYYFIIKDSQGIGERFWFRTAPDKPQPFTFIAGGDTKSDGTMLEAGRASNKMVAKLRPLFVIFNGDFTTGDGTNDERWKLWLDDWMNLTTTSDGRMIPIVPVHGNHENGDKTVLYKLFDVPYQNDVEENIYYSLSFGGDFFHVIALNSEVDEGGDQRAWLENDLKEHQDFTFKMACYHKPFRPHTKSKKENIYEYEQWAPLFFKYRLSIGMGADTHMSSITYPIRPSEEEGSSEGFIRDDETGTMYVGEGSWGAAPRENNDDKPWTMMSGSFNQIKWFHVFPATNDKSAFINIYTVITATFDEDENITTYVDNVVPLTEKNLFEIPKNINLFAPEPHGAVVTYPYQEQK
jgi:hypothetical protein